MTNPSLLDNNPKLKAIVQDLINKIEPRPEDVADVALQTLEAISALFDSIDRIAAAVEKIADTVETRSFS